MTQVQRREPSLGLKRALQSTNRMQMWKEGANHPKDVVETSMCCVNSRSHAPASMNLYNLHLFTQPRTEKAIQNQDSRKLHRRVFRAFCGADRSWRYARRAYVCSCREFHSQAIFIPRSMRFNRFVHRKWTIGCVGVACSWSIDADLCYASLSLEYSQAKFNSLFYIRAIWYSPNLSTATYATVIQGLHFPYSVRLFERDCVNELMRNH